MLNDLAQRIANELQRNLSTISELAPARELKAAVQSALSRMDLVTREEFDAQTAVLLRTRLRLEQLELRMQELEALGQDALQQELETEIADSADDTQAMN